jgi:hypothetical protein
VSRDVEHVGPGSPSQREVNPSSNIDTYVVAVAAPIAAAEMGRRRNARTGRPKGPPSALQVKRDQDRDRLLAFLLEHGASQVHGGHVSLARRVAKTHPIRVFRVPGAGFGAEILPGHEEHVRELLEGSAQEPGLSEAERRRRLQLAKLW